MYPFSGYGLWHVHMTLCKQILPCNARIIRVFLIIRTLQGSTNFVLEAVQGGIEGSTEGGTKCGTKGGTKGSTIIPPFVLQLAKRNIPKGGTGPYRAVEGSARPNGP